MKKLITTMALALMLATPVCNTVSVSADSLLYGDATCDGAVDIRDIAALSQHLVGIKALSQQGLENCGFFNNEVTIKSLSQIKRYLMQEVEQLEFSYYDDGIYDKYMDFDLKRYIIDWVEPNAIIVGIKHQYSNLEYKWKPEELGFTNEEIVEIKDCSVFMDNNQFQTLLVYWKNESIDRLKEKLYQIDKGAINGEYYKILYVEPYGPYGETE